MKKSVLFFLIISFILIALPLIALALSEHPFGQLSSPAEYIKKLYAWGLGIVGATAVTAFAYGGVYYMVGSTKEGKEIMLAALLGLLLLFGAWLVLYTINPDLATFKDPMEGISTPTPPPSPPPQTPDGQFDYDPGIQNQTGDASPALNSFLDCMKGKLPGNVGRISSISDSKIAAGTCSFANCSSQPGGCSHTCTAGSVSCHYGGKGSCRGKSYAADFGDQQNSAAIKSAAKDCNSGAYVLNEGNHIHVSIGQASGCGCN
ncbi:MAG: hypothetical protein V1845_00015 [bacterium]